MLEVLLITSLKIDVALLMVSLIVNDVIPSGPPDESTNNKKKSI